MKINLSSTVAIDVNEIIVIYGLNSKSTEKEISDSVESYFCDWDEKTFYALMNNFSKRVVIIQMLEKILWGK